MHFIWHDSNLNQNIEILKKYLTIIKCTNYYFINLLNLKILIIILSILLKLIIYLNTFLLVYLSKLYEIIILPLIYQNFKSFKH